MSKSVEQLIEELKKQQYEINVNLANNINVDLNDLPEKVKTLVEQINALSNDKKQGAYFEFVDNLAESLEQWHNIFMQKQEETQVKIAELNKTNKAQTAYVKTQFLNNDNE